MSFTMIILCWLPSHFYCYIKEMTVFKWCKSFSMVVWCNWIFHHIWNSMHIEYFFRTGLVSTTFSTCLHINSWPYIKLFHKILWIFSVGNYGFLGARKVHKVSSQEFANWWRSARHVSVFTFSENCHNSWEEFGF